MIPDTLEGAIVLSLIDFFLSIVMISGIGAVLALFPLLNRLGGLTKRSCADAIELCARTRCKRSSFEHCTQGERRP